MTDASKAVKLAGRLPGSMENNGMYSVADALLKDPKKNRLAVIWYDVPFAREDFETDDVIPTMRVLKIEPIGAADEASQALCELVMQKAEQRLGHTPLPFDEVDPDGVTVLSGLDDEDGDRDE